jgi:hypothetical protein
MAPTKGEAAFVLDSVLPMNFGLCCGRANVFDHDPATSLCSEAWHCLQHLPSSAAGVGCDGEEA